MHIVPLSIIIPTRNRNTILRRTLFSLAKQCTQPAEVIIIDSSEKFDSSSFTSVEGLLSKVIHEKGASLGAASQRNEGFRRSCHEIVCFMDDDVLIEPDCLRLLWETINSSNDIGGCNAMITNQKYEAPGRFSSWFYSLFMPYSQSLAGKCIGPAINFLPSDDPELPDVNPVDWLNTTCVFYKKRFLPSPPFASYFTGYSYMEDLTLSMLVGQKAKLVNVKTAKIFHDSQPGDHKQSLVALSRMDLVNRYYLLVKVMGQKRTKVVRQLILQQTFSMLSNLRSFKGVCQLPSVFWGKLTAIYEIK